MFGSDNVCYVYENEGLSAFNSGITFPKLQGACAGESSDSSVDTQRPSRTCAVCAIPLTKRSQKRTCSHICAGKLTPPRDTAGERNGNFRGWTSRRPSVYVRRFEAANPEKVRAHRIVRDAIRRGVLTRPEDCESCYRTKKIDAHHDDYAKPLAVQWLCRKCHSARDRQLAALRARAAAAPAAATPAPSGHRPSPR
jgi:hypothetical protein